MSTTLDQIERAAMTLPADERARLADKLWESLPGDRSIVMNPELERLLDEGLEDLDQAKTTNEIRREK